MFQDGQILGDFEILGRLGQGGMGAVYKAKQISLERLVALKTLRGAIASDPEYIARFRREAKAAAALNHPNLVQVHAAGESDGLHWFAMEYVEGESAQSRIKRKGRLDAEEAIAIGIHVAAALDHAWNRARLIHRDIKPDNIFLSSDGEVKLGDLGLAKSVGEDQSLTMTGASMGTPHYVSPEQVEGQKDVDLRADIYSLGCTLFHFMGGEPPFKADTAVAVMFRHVTEPVPELRGVWHECPDELSRVVMKMMQKQPADRQQTHAEVAADLRHAYDAFASGPALSLCDVTQTPTSSKSKRATAPTIAALGLIAVIAALFHFAPWKKGRTNSGGVSAAEASKIPPTKADAYLGMWVDPEGITIFVIHGDHSAIRTRNRSEKSHGNWEIEADGDLNIKWESGANYRAKLSKDGKSMVSRKNLIMVRKDP